MKKLSLVLCFVMALASLPTFAQEANLTDACVESFDPAFDYFPDKTELRHAENFTVEYFNNYKVVTVTDAFTGAEPFEYVLVQCGTPAPPADDFGAQTQFIEVPAGDIIAMSTTQLPHLEALGLLDNLVGLDSFLYASNPAVAEMIAAGELVEIGAGSTVNVELALETEPDLVMGYGFDPSTDAFPILIEAGIFTAINADWREATPLARAEWNKFIALFYNVEAEAAAIFDEIETAYTEAQALTADIPDDERPTVLVNVISTFTESWVIPGGETYVGLLVDAAGGNVALADEAPTDSAFLSFEAVYDGALDADIWLLELFGVYSLDGLLAQDERFGDFAAVENGNVWNNNRYENENGGNNIFELGVASPHLILQDMIAIFHPELLPDHAFNFYQPME